MLKTKMLFLPTSNKPNSSEFAFLFAGLAFNLPTDILNNNFPAKAFYVGYDTQFGLFICSENPSWAGNCFLAEGTFQAHIAPVGIIPQACLDTFFGIGAHPSNYRAKYFLEDCYPFHSEDIDAMIDAIAPQATTANGDQS